MKTINIELLNKMIANGYIKKSKHLNAELYLYNYTQNTQFERLWNEVTLQCRGLILDPSYNIIARPFPKFFNLGEQEGMVNKK